MDELLVNMDESLMKILQEAEKQVGAESIVRTPAAHSVVIPGGRRLFVRRWEGEGRPLVLLHGLLDSSEGWACLAERTERPCLAIDLPGFGGSDLPEQPRIDSYARHVAAGLHRLGIESCTLVGHSLGGAVAARVAETSDVVDSLALIAPAGFGRIRLAEALSLPFVVDVATAALPLALINPLTVTAAYSTFVSHRRLPERDLIDRLRQRASRTPRAVRAATQAIAHIGRSDECYGRRVADFDGPVAALWGEHDALVPLAHARNVRRAFPQAHVEVWPGMGHHPQREQPDRLASFIETHAAACDGAAKRSRRRAA
jgi:pimeloyl-ACP methyl ester carboxylesterase